ncbi:MAG TPA: glycosyltransferase family 9 protein [Candidatus Dormibacteraeota bacterium]|nr:glycosyltransferase family 9 protein [Candidatus Dormibacteraeota bacterium]
MPSATDGARTDALVVCAGGGIGDSLLASVVGRALHERFARVDALTLPSHRAALERVPDFDAVLADDAEEEGRLAERIAEHAYAAAIVTWATARAARVVRRARIPIRVGQARRLYSGLFTHRVVVRSERGDVSSHWTQVLLDYARAIGCDAADTVPRFVPTGSDDAEADRVARERGLETQRYLILHPSNAIATKRSWPVSGWAALARAAYARFGLPVAVTGSAAEGSIVDGICAAAGDGSVAVAGATSIGAFGSLARRARAYVGITTGAMHVAAAVGAPTVGIFPFQSDFPDRWAPLGAKTAIVRASYPCHLGDTKERCSDYACIANLDVARILAATQEVLR